MSLYVVYQPSTGALDRFLGGEGELIITMHGPDRQTAPYIPTERLDWQEIANNPNGYKVVLVAGGVTIVKR